MIQIEGKYYFESDKISVYPSGYRESIYDIKANLNLEENIIKSNSNIPLCDSYFIDTSYANKVRFIIAGYYFEVNENIFANEYSGMYLELNIDDKTIAGSTTTKVLTPFNINGASGDSLDQTVSSNNIFLGIRITSSPSLNSKKLKIDNKDINIDIDNLSTAHINGRITTGHKDNVASGEYSHAEGLGTKAVANNSLAIGKYNIGKSDTLFEIGCGTGDSSSQRKNIFEVAADELRIGNNVFTVNVDAGVTYNYSFPNSSGTLATQEWTSSNFVSKSLSETINGEKTFTGNINAQGITINGGLVLSGKNINPLYEHKIYIKSNSDNDGVMAFITIIDHNTNYALSTTDKNEVITRLKVLLGTTRAKYSCTGVNKSSFYHDLFPIVAVYRAYNSIIFEILNKFFEDASLENSLVAIQCSDKYIIEATDTVKYLG